MARSLSAHIKRIWPPYLRLIPSYFVINACATTTPFSPDGYREGGGPFGACFAADLCITFRLSHWNLVLHHCRFSRLKETGNKRDTWFPAVAIF
jgi:hypothetical protein